MKSKWYKIVSYYLLGIVMISFAFSAGYALCFFRFDSKAFQSSRFALNIVRSEFVEPLNDQMVAKAIIQGTGDPYSIYFTKDEYTAFEKQLAESYVGIGVLILDSKGKMIIQKVFKNSPAEKNNLKVGWEIRKVDGETVTNKGIEFVAGKIKGPINTETSIVFFDPVENKEISITMNREKIFFETVESKLLSDQTGYIIIHSFNIGTAKEFNKQLDRILAQKPKQIILDLRNNGGGILEETIDIAKRFLKEDSVLFLTQGRNKLLIDRKIGSSNPINLPLIILVNRYSASASEVLSGSIQDHKIGKILGEKTFGKASIQRVFPNPLTGEAVKITVQKYLTPLKNDISNKGIEPDISYTYSEDTINPSEDFEKDPVIKFAQEQFK